VVLALEIVEESALADIRGFGDVFHRDIGKAVLGKELKRRTEQSYTSFSGATLPASQALQVRKTFGSQSFDESGGVRRMTCTHIRPLTIYD
jgi:hypothetical protein